MSQYRAYPAYKDSGIEWIGQVPEHWKVARVKRLASLRNERRNDVSTDTIYIGLEDVEAGSGQYKPTNGSSRQSEDSTVGIFYEGDVLYGKLRPYLRKAIISEMAGCCSTEFLVLRAEKTEPKWLQEWLLTPDVTHQIESGCEGAKMPRADWWHIGSIEVVYPDQHEQAQILTTLDRETARIDALIEKKTRFIELLKEKVIATAMTEQMYGDGEHIRLRHLVQIISRPVQLISEDEYIALGLYNRGRGLFHKPPTLGKDIGDSDFFYVEEGDLILSGQFAWEGAVTMASSTESGCVVSHRYPIVRGGAVATEYLFALLMTNFGDFLLNESSRGSAGRNRPLNINLLLNEKIRMPSVKTQEEIKGLIKLKATLEEKVKHSIDLLKERRAAFITAAVTGQIDLRGKQ
ncbi:TPA: restriction endonuclease subunit S [Aeromonas hydrophila]